MKNNYQNIECCDNLELLKSQLNESVNMIYCDILYGTGRNFGEYQDLKPVRSEIESHYLPRLIEMKRVLKQNGSIYLQMDTRINHWMRILMDDVFGYENFRNEIVWCYNTQGYSKNKYSSKHDNILFYTKSSSYYFNAEIIRNKKPSQSTINRFSNEIEKNGFYIDSKTKKKIYELKGSLPLDWFEMSVLPASHSERTGYSTQKPKALVERIIKASSKEGDIVADYYLGSGTTAVVCKELNRNFIGCDINPKAVELTKQRLNKINKNEIF